MKSAIGNRSRIVRRGQATLLRSIVSAAFFLSAGMAAPDSLPLLTCDATPEREAAQRRADAESPRFLDEEREEIGACGLDLTRFALDARLLPRRLHLDLDGDGAEDSIYPVRSLSDGSPLLALCRGGTWLDLIGPAHPTLKDGDIAHIVRALEKWTVVPANHGAFGYEGEPGWPSPDGDVLVLERIEKGMAIFYWKDEALQSRSLYRFVEP
jgi:hypothetical protein